MFAVREVGYQSKAFDIIETTDRQFWGVLRVPRFIVEAYKRYEVEAESFTEAECKAAAEFNADMIKEACCGGQPADIMTIEYVEYLKK